MTSTPGNLRHNLQATTLTVLGVVILLAVSGCDYARMTDDEAIETYGRKMPETPGYTVPVTGGIEKLKVADPQSLINPLPATPDAVARGRLAYGYYCLHCHGPLADGNGTVGQSFSPLPTDLHGPIVQQLTDGELFSNISLGYKRCPSLALTVAAKDRWAIIDYLRTLAAPPQKS